MPAPVSATALAIASLVVTSAPAQIVPLGFSGGVVVQAGSASGQAMPGTDITTGAHLTVGDASGEAQFHFSPAWNSAAVDLSWAVVSNAFSHTQTSSAGVTRHEL